MTNLTPNCQARWHNSFRTDLLDGQILDRLSAMEFTLFKRHTYYGDQTL